MGFASVHLGGTHVKALGSLSAALSVVDHARGYLYAFHRMPGTADHALQDTVRELPAAGHSDLAADIEGRPRRA
jgi:hypothetical protein